MLTDFSKGKYRAENGYALASVLILVTVLSAVCAIILRVQMRERQTLLESIDDAKSRSASENGVVLSLASIQSKPSSDSTFSISFEDGSSANVAIYPWGLFTGVRSQGVSHNIRSIRSALLASSLTDSEGVALVLGNLQHGLVFTGRAKIIGDVAVGPMGVSTGNLRNYSAPQSVPIKGKRTTSFTQQSFSDTLALFHHVFLSRTLLNRIRRYPVNQDESGHVLECQGSPSLHEVNDSIVYVYCSGSLNLTDTIMRRGPPLYIVAQGPVSFRPNVFLSGPISICSIDSIVVPPSVSLTNCTLTSEKSIVFQSVGSVQLFSPVIHLSSNAVASYPSAVVSVSFADSSGTIQSIELDNGSRVEGAVVMHRTNTTSMSNAVVVLSPGATVVGGVYTDAYLTLDGTVRGYVRAFDLYFYDSPTTYLGWMRQGIIDRSSLPNGFLKPFIDSGSDTLKVLTWM